MQNFASEIRLVARLSLFQSADCSRPVRRRLESTRASLASKRSVSASPDISHENTSAGVPCSIAAYSAQFMARTSCPSKADHRR